MVIDRAGLQSKARLGHGVTVYQFSCLHAYDALIALHAVQNRITPARLRVTSNRIKISFFLLQTRCDDAREKERRKKIRSDRGEQRTEPGRGEPN